MNKITIAEFAKRQGISKAKAYAMAEKNIRLFQKKIKQVEAVSSTCFIAITSFQGA